MPWWVDLAIDALVIGWLVALVDAWWRLQALILDLRRAVASFEEKPANSGENVSDD